ncbi:PLP-dependent aminotransferase family protein [Chitinophaga solisilvae]|uniref:MocR-like pyridoxine biosynthesis transcription factor PdxR n=1 Tax=Chitinophaga solisilvae TaxID=1233460 RepID=UPI0013717836|nr:PLP-dependent aminotransferase family protein [Chitinophaga solisilvae]
MQHLYSQLRIEKEERQPVYLQLADQLMSLIRNGPLHAGQRLPSSRDMAEQLQVHRKTVVRAYDELLAQGWLESHTGSGTFVARHLPKTQLQTLNGKKSDAPDPLTKAGFSFEVPVHLERPIVKSVAPLHLDDGFPDSRLAPLEELSRCYRSQLLLGNPYMRLGYSDTNGTLWLRQELSAYLNETRGLHTTPDNILVVRGTIMGMYLVATGLLQPGDNVVTGDLSWAGAGANAAQVGAHLLKIPVDEYGLDTTALEQLCKKKKIRLVYVTPHHHYPTTVIMRADRRLHLLQLAEKYGFIIFEDDYDYDFHYLSKPLTPLASADKAGMVMYGGSFTKAVSPAFRIGYLVGPADVLNYLSKLRRIIDRQGDNMLENAIAALLQSGVIQRCLRKSLRIYRERRDVFCDLLQTELGKYVQFQPPVGGLAVWADFDKRINMAALSQQALRQDLYIYDGSAYRQSLPAHNFTRLGFASSTPEELEECVGILKVLLGK